jgi:glycosidase
MRGMGWVPTVYYGDEVGITGADDPEDRRTYPWTSGTQNVNDTVPTWRNVALCGN